ncbi:DUF1097 domain-containing protein [Xanthomonas sp. AmX2]|uniref:DUF1097 domain-containing protein n=1 Tax=Xanthomonas sp. TaxID=29446 RepID=UPI00197F8200|nr:DUF1097 domain-containing protein [Xanthomonas sp.]MBN6152360.1 DUF1097 domain-containing protein [Xanthomonas sp.]
MAADGKPGLGLNAAESAVAATAAALAALVLEVPVWAMFIGWIAYFTRAPSLRQGAVNFACVLGGLLLGIAASLAIAALAPLLGAATLPLVVFVVSLLVLSMARVPVFNNLLGFFLGLVSWFAAHQPPSVALFAELALAALLGSTAGWIAAGLHRRAARGAA